MPTSLALHDMGLSTFKSYSNVDANGGAISPDQICKVQRLRRWNKIFTNNRSYHRNLKNAFAILNTIKDKLSLSDALLEKSAYNYRKALDKRIIKGRSIRSFVVACCCSYKRKDFAKSSSNAFYNKGESSVIWQRS